MCPVVPCLFLYFFTICGQMGICFRRIQNQRKQKRQESSMWSNTAICHDLIKRAKILEFQRKDKRYSARFTNRYGRRMQFYHEKLSVVRKWLNDAKYEDEHVLAGTGEKVCVSEWFWQ